MNRELLTQSYDFELPQDRIATHPASPRDHAKLLVYNRATDTLSHARFYELEHYLPKNTALIFNNTKVIKARLFGIKESGGKVEILINKPLNATELHAFIRGRVKVGMKIIIDDELSALVKELLDDGSRVIEFLACEKVLRFEELLPYLDRLGHIPLPPYIQREDNEEDVKEYQSVFAKHEGAVAAPTASLHFSDEQHKRICQNFSHAYITLHVGSGTFKPVEAQTITDHPMHSEYYEISPEAKKFLDSDQPILCVGTTATRTVEYYARHQDETSGEANLFLHPNNRPLRVNHLLTNFHLPKSTLIMLVASFVGLDKTLELYHEAIKNDYRFYSYGDAMLIL
ncbi:MAG: tRNA preQ1(34) S-adenosylmethionine ribosyltransferase-isomerase QueA [Epsilonproteobacteria bacterium]|nr:tRNA preQ1(34) S-adenosylmethionine ribosyltransferase-isomerase QueA [Campylobacterota bacterium]